jgi:hypothetical protein
MVANLKKGGLKLVNRNNNRKAQLAGKPAGVRPANVECENRGACPKSRREHNVGQKLDTCLNQKHIDFSSSDARGRICR